MNRLAENLASVKARIAKAATNCGRNHGEISLIAVSKTRNSDEIRTIFDQGHRHFGENYLQEALTKIEELRGLGICWHFIGPVQSNKTRAIAEHFDWVQSVDRIKIAQRLNDQRPDDLSALNTCIQINLDGEDSKSGTTYESALELAEIVSTLPKLKLRGLMYIPAPQSSFEAQLKTCQQAAEEFERLRKPFPSMDSLSLGMSSDLEAAIQAGSSMVRIGTDIFGPRNYSAKKYQPGKIKK